MNQRDALHYIETRQEFTASALSGKAERYTPQTGRLNNQEAERLIADFNRMTALYVVYSYGTPIAWHSIEGWYIVSQKFSVTTSKHTNAVRRAITSELVGAN
jgi:hypothetical protein